MTKKSYRASMTFLRRAYRKAGRVDLFAMAKLNTKRRQLREMERRFIATL